MIQRTSRLPRNATLPRLLALAAAAAVACLFVPGVHAQVRAVGTTTMVTDLVKNVGGPRVTVDGLMGPGVDPHLYKPTASDVSLLRNAEVIFYSGLHLEGRMTELFDKMAKSGRPVIAVAAGMPEDRLLKSEAFQGHPDPHVWGDASLWALTIDTVVEALSKADAGGAADYRRRGDAYRQQLLELHAWAGQRVAELPAAGRVLITSHDAFNYFGRAYGFEVVGVQGISTVAEAGLADMAKTVDLIKERRVKAIFVESSVPHATIERISSDSGAKIGGELFSDALGTPGLMESANGGPYDTGTYVGMLKHNVNTVVEALK